MSNAQSVPFESKYFSATYSKTGGCRHYCISHFNTVLFCDQFIDIQFLTILRLFLALI